QFRHPRKESARAAMRLGRRRPTLTRDRSWLNPRRRHGCAGAPSGALALRPAAPPSAAAPAFGAAAGASPAGAGLPAAPAALAALPFAASSVAAPPPAAASPALPADASGPVAAFSPAAPAAGACCASSPPVAGTVIGGGSVGMASTIDDDRCRVELHVRKSDVNMKSAAVHVVSRVSRFPAPLDPKIVWLDPPKTAPMSAPFPVCSSTTTIK